MVVNAWNRRFSHQSICDIDDAVAIGQDLEDNTVSLNARDPSESLILDQEIHLWNKNAVANSFRKSSRAIRNGLHGNKKVMPLLQRGLIFFHMSRWAESVTMP